MSNILLILWPNIFKGYELEIDLYTETKKAWIWDYYVPIMRKKGEEISLPNVSGIFDGAVTAV